MEPQQLVIPQIPKLITCRVCGHPYGPFRAHKGSTKKELEGVIFQQCANHKLCHNIIYHTQPYPYHIAELLANALKQQAQHNVQFVQVQPVFQALPAQQPNGPLLQAPFQQLIALPAPTPAVVTPAIVNASPASISNTVHHAPLNANLPTSQPLVNTGQPSKYIYCLQCRSKNGASTRAARNCISKLCKSCCKHEYLDAFVNKQFRDQCRAHHTEAVLRPPSLAPASTPQATTSAQPLAPSTTQIQVGREVERCNIKKINIGPLWREEKELADVKARRHEIEEALMQSVTAVICYRDGVQPLELPQRVQTFPRYVLANFLCDLELLRLEAGHRLGTYEPQTRTWSLDDIVTDCPGLEEEEKCQHGELVRPSKHCLDDASVVKTEPDTTLPVRASNDSERLPAVSALSSPKGHMVRREKEKDQKGHNSGQKGSRGVLDASKLNVQAWPSQWTVKEIGDGLDEIKRKTEGAGCCYQKDTFKEVFAQTSYVKSTLWEVRNAYDDAPVHLREHFLQYGKKSEGLWPKFTAVIQKYNTQGSSSDFDPSEAEQELHRKLTAWSKDRNPQPSTNDVNGTGSNMLDLCPYCEQAWPKNPSDALQQLHTELDLDANSLPEPTLTCSYAR
ncbi:hypothetical protein M422DRAFT_261121 [Sphaerobolus stellatus SS14]|uniref:Restriction of telomere capping protein 4 n=1 Tax=Sphaerobolus stellatus (strain SS14) TaxID=990650 RepID=A0A0C9V493_SPHS4|nr:hypothetical protein M422DRAFT_261121 [Sphaerobolus stellatus SS14]